MTAGYQRRSNGRSPKKEEVLRPGRLERALIGLGIRPVTEGDGDRELRGSAGGMLGTAVLELVQKEREEEGYGRVPESRMKKEVGGEVGEGGGAF